MSKIQIMTGSASDISYEDEREYNISVKIFRSQSMISLPLRLGTMIF